MIHWQRSLVRSCQLEIVSLYVASWNLPSSSSSRLGAEIREVTDDGDDFHTSKETLRLFGPGPGERMIHDHDAHDAR